ncbi:HAD hydrolase-like protein [Synechococcus sp. RS9916]|uniref:HAD hydrolase-like protein n=1 Tax=Synechococcus sp. RS9916 TaxID=221359 RepID=UPI000903652C|nr:HAD hydrolase-like protein [Synechococcus sp. RS9916]
MQFDLRASIDNYDTFVFDFDGVIKDSVPAKSKAFSLLFSSYPSVLPRIVAHHLANGGISRDYKLPLYMSWCGIDPSDINVSTYTSSFSSIVSSLVINSPFVLGIYNYLEFLSSNSKRLYILSATPQQEIIDISLALQLTQYFSTKNIYGHPATKSSILQRLSLTSPVLFFGDSLSDFQSSIDSNVDFVFCSTNPSVTIPNNTPTISSFL